MTRETKIGLLVGLAFIIVIGILLSEYNRLETQPAQLAGVGQNVRDGANTLHNDSNQDETVPPPATAPTHPVLTHDELRSESIVDIGPGHGAVRPIPPGGQSPAGEQPGDRVNGHGAADSGAAISITPGGRNAHPLPGPGLDNPNPNPPAQPAPATTQYVAQAGDSVSRMAGRLLGKNTSANREAIIAANPSLKKNPNNVVIGHTYTIPARKPADATATVLPLTPVASDPAPSHPEAPAANHVEAPATPQYWYTVKENDNLWKIAKEQLGNGAAWASIKELNHDVLKGGDAVHANMRLRLPAKPHTATASTAD